MSRKILVTDHGVTVQRFTPSFKNRVLAELSFFLRVHTAVCLVGTVSSSKKAKFCPAQAEMAQEISEEDYQCHVAELAREWTKQKRNTDHINVLLRDTFVNRRAWICQLPAGEFSQIVEMFPCFEDGQFVSNILHAMPRFHDGQKLTKKSLTNSLIYLFLLDQ